MKSTRRQFVSVAQGLLAASIGRSRANAAPDGAPNVLFISIDDLNDWIGVLGGHPQTKTPNLDRLAKRGALFTRAYTVSPSCNPSRTALMTGIPPYQSGVYDNNQAWRPAMPDAVTLPQHFQKSGYWAGGSGKVYHGVYPDPASWDAYWPSKTKQKPTDDPLPSNTPVNGIPATGGFDWAPLAVPDNEMGDARVADWVISQLQAKHDKPFFLACGLWRPHLPWYVPEKYFKAFPVETLQLPEVKEDDLADVPAAGVRMAEPDDDHAKVIQHDQWREAVQGYLAAVHFSDTMLGRVIDALDDSPYRDNTVIVLWSDHGWHLGEKSHWRKFTLWEEATHVPLMFVAPEGMPGLPQGTSAGTRCIRPVSLLDIYPTLLELCGLTPKDDLAGVSLVPLLKDPQREWSRPALSTHGRLNHAVRSQRFRYIRYEDGSEELYDHSSDPMEWDNLAGDPNYRETIADLAKWLPAQNAPDRPRQDRDKRTNEIP